MKHILSRYIAVLVFVLCSINITAQGTSFQTAKAWNGYEVLDLQETGWGTTTEIYYKFTVSSARYISFDNYDTAVGIATTLTLYNSSYTELLKMSGSGNTHVVLDCGYLAAGTYYLKANLAAAGKTINSIVGSWSLYMEQDIYFPIGSGVDEALPFDLTKDEVIINLKDRNDIYFVFWHYVDVASKFLTIHNQNTTGTNIYTLLTLYDELRDEVTASEDTGFKGALQNMKMTDGEYCVGIEVYDKNSSAYPDCNLVTTFLYSDAKAELPDQSTSSLQLSSDQNYIHTRTYTADNGNSYLDQVQYFDGLGRPVQAIQAGITPTGKDLISLQEYDAFGRESNAWQPAAISSSNGAYTEPATVMAAAKTTNTNSGTADQLPYSKPVYEASPLNRVLEQYGSGADWHNNKKAVRTAYMANIAGIDTLNCIYYTTADPGDTIVSVTRVKNYDTGQLYVTRIEDEDGNTSLEFKDKLGQVVLTRQIQRNGNSKDLHDTYYIYDDFGNLKAVLPPLAADAMKTGTSWTNSASDIIRKYAYLYKYDGRNRCIAKRLPGTHWVYYVYDKADQLILSQDGEQRANSQWAFNAYDKFGRVVFSGIHKDHYGPQAGRTHNYLINQFKDLVIQETSGWLYSYSLLLFNQLGTAPYGYKRCNGIANEILQVNYYDNYNCTGRPEFADIRAVEAQPAGFTGKEHSSAKGMLTGTLIYYNEERGNTDLCYHDLKSIATVIRYDNRGRVIQTKSTNHLGGVDKEFVDYNFTGQPTRKKHIHSATGKTTQTEDYAYSYDHAGRLLKTTHKLNGGTEMILAENTYDELGRLATKKSNNRNELNATYTYNVRSWLSKIRHYHFHEDLNYTHSGNIKNMQWVLYGQTRKYDYTYDNLSRLKAATFSGITGEQYSTAYTYDKHGNILSLQRYGKKDAGTNASSFGLVDNLTMAYNGNQLVKAEDVAANVILSESADFKNHNNVAVEYTYNKNGAITKDLNKGVSQIQYNSLNLPTLTDIKNPEGEGRNYYTYSASGVKLKVKHTYNPNFLPAPVTGSDVNVSSLTQVTETDYVGNKVYENGALKRVLIDGGYIEGGTYYFYVNDHLGNNRAVARADGPIFQRNHYYPFGMAFADSYNSNIQPYKYNGKELDRKHGLNLYDYSARYYDQAIGRFTTVDPLAEDYYSISPYVYCNNNPLKYIDPTGMWYDDYFNFQGKYLGTDKSTADNVRVIDEGQYNLNKELDGSIDPAIGTSISILHSKAALSNEVSFKIYSHYNPTELTTKMATAGGFDMAYSRTTKKSTGELTSETLKINPIVLKKDGYADNINDIKNIFAHEKGHYNHYHKVGNDAYSKLSKPQREFEAFTAQMNDPTWVKTSSNLRDHMGLYMNRLGISIIKMEAVSYQLKEVKSSIPLSIK